MLADPGRYAIQSLVALKYIDFWTALCKVEVAARFGQARHFHI